ncbi:MAG: chorismate mutase [Bacillota bacterium]|nr:chorismate mutase [Bacillota bacterium]
MNIKECRTKIDAIDQELLRLFVQRMQLAAEIAGEKSRCGLAVYNPEREQQILQQVKKASPDQLWPYAEKLFYQLFSLSRAYQLTQQEETLPLFSPQTQLPEKPLLACLKQESSTTSQVAKRLFPQAELLTYQKHEDLLAAVKNGLCQYGFFSEGSSCICRKEIYRLLQEQQLYITYAIRERFSTASQKNRETTPYRSQEDPSFRQRTKPLTEETDLCEEKFPAITSRFFLVGREARIFFGHTKICALFLANDAAAAMKGLFPLFTDSRLQLSRLDISPLSENNPAQLVQMEVKGEFLKEDPSFLLARFGQDPKNLSFLGAFPEKGGDPE